MCSCVDDAKLKHLTDITKYNLPQYNVKILILTVDNITRSLATTNRLHVSIRVTKIFD